MLKSLGRLMHTLKVIFARFGAGVHKDENVLKQSSVVNVVEEENYTPTISIRLYPHSTDSKHGIYISNVCSEELYNPSVSTATKPKAKRKRKNAPNLGKKGN